MLRRLVAPALAGIAVSLLASVSAVASDRAVCPLTPHRGHVTCYAYVRMDQRHVHRIERAAVPSPAGYHPADLQAAYGLTAAAATRGGSQTVAIVDADNDPNAASDLAAYRAAFDLPPCSTANGCFRQVGQTGSAKLPAGSIGWATEISLDADMVSAMCPNCKILLVEASSTRITDLLVAEDYATAHATVVANSWGTPEFFGQTLYDSHFRKPVPITFSSGDAGYGVQYPAASTYVTAVGGTSLIRSAGTRRAFTETAWAGAGSGCSSFELKPAWQLDTGCARRTIADVSAVANPGTGVSGYDSYGQPGWVVFGGTSVSSPIVAGAYALAGGSGTSLYPSLPYAHTGALFDIVSGSNGRCAPSYLCTAGPGVDGPTGLGTPNGISAF